MGEINLMGPLRVSISWPRDDICGPQDSLYKTTNNHPTLAQSSVITVKVMIKQYLGLQRHKRLFDL